MHSETPGFVRCPALKDRIHCVAYVIEACTFSPMSEGLIDTPSSQQSGFEHYSRFGFCLIFRGSSAGPDD